MQSALNVRKTNLLNNSNEPFQIFTLLLDRETEDQRGSLTCKNLHSYEVAELQLKYVSSELLDYDNSLLREGQDSALVGGRVMRWQSMKMPAGGPHNGGM